MQEEEVIARLPAGWQDLVHCLCKSAEVAELWYMDAMQSSYGHRPEWHSLLRSLQVKDPCIVDSQLVFKPRFVLLSVALQGKFLTFLVKESFLVSDRDLLEFVRTVRDFVGVDQETCVGRQMTMLCQQIKGYSDSDDKQPCSKENDVVMKTAGESDIDMETQVTDSNPGSNEQEEVIIIDEEVEEPVAKRQKLDEENGKTVTEVIQEDGKTGHHDYKEVKLEGRETEGDSAEGISVMIEKLKEILQSGEEEGFPEMLSEVSKLSLKDIEWFCKRIDFAEMTDDSTEVMCKHMCYLAELLSYRCAVCMLRYVILDKVLQLTQTPSRKLSGAITLVAEKFPKQLIDSVLVACIMQEDISSFQAEVLCRLTKNELTLNSRSYFVQKLFTNYITISESKLPVMQTIFESSFDADENVVNQMIDSFDLVSENFAKNLKFGKLLLAIVNKHGTLLKCETRLKFSSIVDRHGTFLKKSVKNALNKLK